MTKTTQLSLFALLSLLVVPGGESHAGMKHTNPVSVDPVNRRASGDMATARSSAGAETYIGCVVYARTGYAPLVYCEANTDANVHGQCMTTDPGFIQIAASAGPNSRYYFAWDSAATCTRLTVENYSIYGLIQP